MTKNVLLVEDEHEKYLALVDALKLAGFDAGRIHHCVSVRDAVLAVYGNDYELVVLDVSLPTYGPEGMIGSAGRAQQQSGGVEVLRALKSSQRFPRIVIVTQYPDILFGDVSVQLRDVRAYAHDRYGQSVIGAVLYRESDSFAWRAELSSILGGM